MCFPCVSMLVIVFFPCVSIVFPMKIWGMMVSILPETNQLDLDIQGIL